MTSSASVAAGGWVAAGKPAGKSAMVDFGPLLLRIHSPG
jgi:hypothetical protein